MQTKPGRLFMYGIYGTRATRESVSLLKDTGACGVLLLARNIESPAQTKRLVHELQDKVGRPLLFAVDHEGGWVLRFDRGLTAFPGNAALGRAGDPRLAYAQGRRMALELGALGIRLNLAPVLDVVTDRYNPGIGIRSFGRDPALAGRLGAAFIRGLQDHGVSATAKHFPGKGAAAQDAHLTLPTIGLPPGEFRKVHLAPFRAAVRAGVRCIMTSHVAFPGLDPSRAPATFSPKITGRLLRRELGFAGTVIADDLCMGAVTERMPIQEAAVRALEAGHDILLIAHDRNAQREAVDLLDAALAGGRVSQARLDESGRRVQALFDMHGRPIRKRTAPGTGSSLARGIAGRAVEIVQRGGVPLPLPLGGRGYRSAALLWPDVREVKDRFTFEGGPQATFRRMRARVARWPAKSRLILTPVLAGGPKAEDAARRAARADLAVFFCFEAMRFPGQKETLERLQAGMAGRLVVCLIRNPWDRALLRPGVTALDGYGYRDCSIQALFSNLVE